MTYPRQGLFLLLGLACCLRMIRLNIKANEPIRQPPHHNDNRYYLMPLALIFVWCGGQLPEFRLLVNGALSAPSTELLVFKLTIHLLLILPRIVIHPAAGGTLQPY